MSCNAPNHITVVYSEGNSWSDWKTRPRGTNQNQVSSINVVMSIIILYWQYCYYIQCFQIPAVSWSVGWSTMCFLFSSFSSHLMSIVCQIWWRLTVIHVTMMSYNHYMDVLQLVTMNIGAPQHFTLEFPISNCFWFKFQWTYTNGWYFTNGTQS